MKLKQFILSLLFFSTFLFGKTSTLPIDSNEYLIYEKGLTTVNHCTPWHHAQCVLITGTEVYEDGRDGKKGRHWWRMSYIGRACTDKYGKVLGTIFEGIWAIPHYTGVVIGSGFGYLVYVVRGPRNPEKVAKRKQKREERKKK
ncbi:MAG: hypothetical protein JKX68_02680 [Flavobacteriales bacterium]|nr:hypothetical protein [Flavobacteriales bacterium]